MFFANHFFEPVPALSIEAIQHGRAAYHACTSPTWRPREPKLRVRRRAMTGCPIDPSAPAPAPGAAATPGDLQHHDAKLDFSADMSYGDYLHLDEVLNAQHPLSPDHNEMLFIVQHQTSELWMKLMLHELRAAVRHIAADELHHAFKMLARVSRIMEQLVHAWDVLATMTPPEYSAIRPYLANSSGFQDRKSVV